jgi:hypothetical protein
MRIATSSLDLPAYWKVYGAPEHPRAAPGAADDQQERQAIGDNDTTR